ncbi:MAG: family 43 glycosylhydrolase [Lachnospiraceae bacterium]|nr:family 43 glycosylhydrolase [Lachnospiraceae bacterium]
MKKIAKKVTVLSSLLCLMAAGSVQAASYTTNFGDLNEDEMLNVLDMEDVQKNILGLSELTDEKENVADVNRDGIINVKDMEEIQKDILGVEKIENITVTETDSTVSVHDPSIIKDEATGTYYIFGSHLAWAKSTDLCNWKTFTNNINTNYATLFKAEAEWAKKADSSYKVDGNMWAPDVIWNKDMNKWCMYMSINGPKWNSTICLLTADSLDGNWTYVGPVIQSGMSMGYGVTFDYTKVTGETTVNSRYTDHVRNGNPTYEPHAIDPCVLYDEEGNLWMSYGSWSGGIGMIRLDNETGLRDYNITYKLDSANLTDPYTGYKLAGGNQVSGEASYIQKIGDYYYLFLSYGGLAAKGGYSMRIFRSETITGPYVDESGNDARYPLDGAVGSTGAGNINGTVGIKLMTYYKWSTMNVAQVAQGHNSAFVDSDGKAYVVYHTRTNDGTEGHYVKTHQLFTNEDGWLVAAPYRYSGETLNEEGYSASKVAGTYEVLMHKQSINYQSLEYVSPVEITLNTDGTVSGTYTGTWSLTENSPYITVNMNNHTYKGVVIRQIIEGTSEDTMCFTLLGDDEMEVWGSMYLTGKRAVKLAQEKLTVASIAVDDLTLPTEALYGTTISWSSGNKSIITDEGKLTKPETETTVTLTATFSNNGYSEEKTYDVKVYEAPANDTDPYIVAKYYTNEAIDLTNAKEGTYAVPNPFNEENTSGLEIYNGAAIEFEVTRTGAMDRLDNIIGFTDSGSGKLYFTGGSYLGYNATGGYYDANMANWTLQKDYIGTGAKVRIDFLPTGYEVRVNGTLVYSNETVDVGTTAGANNIDGYNNVLKWLNSSATTLNFGWGNWWSDLQYDGTISNVVCYAYPIEKIDTSEYAYYEGYEKSDVSMWTSANASGALVIKNDGDSHGNYMNFATGTDSGNRGAYAAIDCALSENYTIETDVKLTPGNVANRSLAQFAITTTGTDAAANNNSGISKGYLVKLSADPNSNVYTINDGSATVTIPSDTWVTIKAAVTTDNNVVLTITNQTTNAVLFSGNVTANGSSELNGLYLLRGRGTGTASVDTIRVTDNR